MVFLIIVGETSECNHAVESFWKDVYSDSQFTSRFKQQYLTALAYQVVALTLILIQKGCYEPIIDSIIFERALSQIKFGRCCANIGTAAEGLKHISNDANKCDQHVQ